MINERAQQVSNLRVGTTFELVAGKPARDPGYEVGDLHARFPTGVDEPNVGQLASRPTGGVDGCDIGNAFRRQRGRNSQDLWIGVFMPLADYLLVDLGRWVVRRVCR